MRDIFKSLIVSLFIFCCSCNGGGEKAPESAPVTSFKGEQLFKDNCYQCHRPGMEALGPNLAGVKSRWKDAQLLYSFIRNPQQVIATNAYARALQEKYKGQLMLPFPQLQDEEIDAILQYCDEAGK